MHYLHLRTDIIAKGGGSYGAALQSLSDFSIAKTEFLWRGFKFIVPLDLLRTSDAYNICM